MHLRPYRVLLWTGFFLLVIEFALEVRALNRGWEALLLGREPGWQNSSDPAYGPVAGFPFRSRIFAPGDDPDQERVWVASSSYGEDTQLAADLIFPNLLGLRLGAQLINASRAGLHVRSNTEQLRELGPVWKPTVVVLYQMSNDIDRISEAQAKGQALGKGGGTPGQAGTSGGSNPISRRLTTWAEQLTVYKHLKMQVTTRLAAARSLRSGIGHEGAAVYRAWVEEFIKAARELGARPVLCTFATSHTLSTLEQVPAHYQQQVLAMNVELSVEGWLSAVADLNASLRVLAAEQGLPLADVAAAVGDRPELFRDLWHMTPAGHAAAAAAIAAALEE